MTPIRTFTIECKPDCKFWLIGAPRNWKPGDSWLVTHDVFHHFEGHDGSVGCEIMSFGVEGWLEATKVGLERSLSPGTMGSTLADELEHGITARRLARLTVGPAPKTRFPNLSADAKAVLTNFAHAGLLALERQLVNQFGSEFPDRARAAILAEANYKNCRDWVLYGYELAQKTYLNPEAFSAAFELLYSCVEKLEVGERARFSLTTEANLVAENFTAARCAALVRDRCSPEDAERLCISEKAQARLMRTVCSLS